MSLSGVLNTARFALETTAAHSAVVSRNVAGASDPAYSRKFAEGGSMAFGGQDALIRRAENPVLFARATEARSQSAAASALLDGITRMRALFGDTDAGDTPSARMDGLRSALKASAVDASDPVLAGRAVEAARNVADGIRGAALSVAALRTDIEGQLAAETTRLNGHLAAFEQINARIINGTRAGNDVTDLMDQRDTLMRSISDSVGVRAIRRADNDMVLQTDSGAMLFETRARAVTYLPEQPVAAGQPGGRLLIDGVTVAGPGAVLPLSSGAMQGLVALRDGAMRDMETKLDETARILVSGFRETDRTGGGKPDKAGLFVIDGSATIPPDGVVSHGLARSLAITDAVNPATGGNPLLLRDGGLSGDADYRANLTGAPGFPGRLQELAAALDAPVAADPSAGLGEMRSPSDFAARTFGWLEETRRGADSRAEFLSVVATRTDESLAAETGVSLDAEMTHLLELERSYSASAKLITVVDGMYAALLNAVR